MVLLVLLLLFVVGDAGAAACVAATVLVMVPVRVVLVQWGADATANFFGLWSR